MLLLLAPSKTQDFESPLLTKTHTQTRLIEHTLELANELKGYSKDKLAKLMAISEKLAEVNFKRYQDFQTAFTSKNSRQAILAFKGDVYTDVDVDNYSEEDFKFAQKHVRTLSGLYGLLRPLDLMQPYRLEMKTKLKTNRGKNLYEFWGDHVTDLINQDLEAQGDAILVNLTSDEYYKVVSPKKVNGRIINIVFMDQKRGKDPRIVPLYSKRTRGTMANFVVKHQLTNPKDLKRFNVAGYQFDAKSSTDNEFVFLRIS